MTTHSPIIEPTVGATGCNAADAAFDRLNALGPVLDVTALGLA